MARAEMFKLCIFFELLSGSSVSMISVKRLNPLRSIINRFVYQNMIYLPPTYVCLQSQSNIEPDNRCTISQFSLYIIQNV